MPSYKPPVDDIRFILNEVLHAGEMPNEIEDYIEADWETVSTMIETIGDFAAGNVFPTNMSADAEGLTYNPEDKSVKTPDSFKELNKNFVEMGMLGLTASPAHGGFGMPAYLGTVLNEMMCANASYSLYPGLTGSAYKALKKFGSDELQKTYLPKLLDGTCSGTMCLTEPQAGTDLALIKSKAEPQDDGSYAVTGNKIFISFGENDLGDNIAHMVLARLPDAPAGIKGISMFIVPKFIPDENGEPGERNSVECTGLEEKMGIHASPTCSMSFDGAKGWLVGEPHKGMKAMFSMMNDARLKVGMQGLGIAEIAYQNVAKYAAERVQGKALKESFNPNAEATQIINHANVKKTLLDMKSQIQGFRALAYDTAMALDVAEKHPETVVRQNAEAYAALMTPVLKSCMTDLGVEVANKSIQLYGGAGFITETGAHQYYRDAVIATIYEGTNDVQAMDFTFRKALDVSDMGFKLGLFMNPLKGEIENAKGNDKIAAHADTLEKGMEIFQQSTMGLVQQGMSGKADNLLTHSRDFMDMFGKLAAGRMWLKMMETAQQKLDQGITGKAADYYQDKLQTGEYYMNRIMLPEMKRLEMRMEAGAATVVKAQPESLTPGDELGIGKEQAVSSKGKNRFMKPYL